MAKTNQFKLDATRPFYAFVGAGDLAVEYARTAATDVQSRIGKVELEPKALRDQARTIVVTRVEALTEDAKGAQAKFEARVAEFQSDAKSFPAKVESFVNETVADATETYGDLAARGKGLVSRIRKQSATQDVKAAAKTVVAKAKTTRTQVTKSARKSVQDVTQVIETGANDTGSTVKRNVKATSTSAKKAASAASDATTDAASKIGN